MQRFKSGLGLQRTLLMIGILGFMPSWSQWAAPKVLHPEILTEMPHDTAAFTQGLVWLDGKLFESTGLYGKSTLRELNPETGAVLRSFSLPPEYFAEGLAAFQGEFIQLTWREGVAFRYPVKRWIRPSRFTYIGEGWGITSMGQKLCMSNGSDTLYIRNAAFKVIRKVPVRLAGKPLLNLNELEFVGSVIVANVWYSDSIYIINPRNGDVLAVVDGTEMVARSRRHSREEVLNGIAYNSRKKMFLITGKNWPIMFKVRIPYSF